MKRYLLVTIGCTFCLWACDSESSEGSSSASSGKGASCSTSSDCPDSQLCLETSLGRYCTLNCSVSASECSGSAGCEGVGAIEVSVCNPDPVTEDETPDAESQPSLPCQTDAECAAKVSSTICAEWQGERDCTIGCTQESECTPPSVAGVTMDFLTCATDEGDTSRTACLPDPACFTNPMSCISGFPGF